jgi:hypothetical protein
MISLKETVWKTLDFSFLLWKWDSRAFSIGNRMGRRIQKHGTSEGQVSGW